MLAAAVRATGLSKRFETTCAVDEVDIVVGRGEVRGLLGPNGAGKTTLLRLLLGLVARDGGTIEFFGREQPTDEWPVLDGVAGFVEEPTFYPYLSGRANLEVLIELDGGGEKALIDEVLDRVDLLGQHNQRVSGYSTGMRQRLGIAAALMREPMLLLLDEPTSGLDPGATRDVLELVRQLSSETGLAVLLSSHQIGIVESVCDSFTVLRSGRVVWDGTASELRSQAPRSTYRVRTSDDVRALELARADPTLGAERSRGGEIHFVANDGRLDSYVLALGSAGIAVRRLELVVSAVESMFFALTADDEVEPLATPVTPAPAVPAGR